MPFACFKKRWERELLEYNYENVGRELNKANWFSVFNPAFQEAFSLKAIQAGFRETGIYPPDYGAIDQSKLLPSKLTDSKGSHRSMSFVVSLVNS